MNWEELTRTPGGDIPRRGTRGGVFQPPALTRISGCSGPSVEVASRQITSGLDPARGSALQANLVLLVPTAQARSREQSSCMYPKTRFSIVWRERINPHQKDMKENSPQPLLDPSERLNNLTPPTHHEVLLMHKPTPYGKLLPPVENPTNLLRGETFTRPFADKMFTRAFLQSPNSRELAGLSHYFLSMTCKHSSPAVGFGAASGAAGPCCCNWSLSAGGWLLFYSAQYLYFKL